MFEKTKHLIYNFAQHSSYHSAIQYCTMHRTIKEATVSVVVFKTHLEF